LLLSADEIGQWRPIGATANGAAPERVRRHFRLSREPA